MRILVDHSGYDLRNLGDVAMLQVCVSRLRQAHPKAGIDVVTTDAERLRLICPEARPIRSGLLDGRAIGKLPSSAGLALEQMWKAAGPYLLRDTWSSAGQPTVLDAIGDADLVVAAGGGYLTDIWWWHAAGVLSVLAAAQRLGKPTAMVGQGLGPLTHPLVRRQAAAVLPRLIALGLREGVIGLPLARELGVPADVTTVTGDDALELALPASPTAAPNRLGVNVRLTGYTNLDSAAVSSLGSVIRDLAEERDLLLTALPVSRHAMSDDLEGVRQLLDGVSPQRLDLDDLATPAALAAAAGSCQAVVTASYHAAVFALAAGVPAVCLTRSGYYDAKFNGLADLFPSATTVVPMAGPDLGERLRSALMSACDTSATDRAAARDSARAQVQRSRALYEDFLTASMPRTALALP
jgi:polysaccharide pyruvyl transferase WcaK-like protein